MLTVKHGLLSGVMLDVIHPSICSPRWQNKYSKKKKKLVCYGGKIVKLNVKGIHINPEFRYKKLIIQLQYGGTLT